MQDRFFWLCISWVVLHCADCYYSSRRCYGTGDCHLMTKNQDGGFDDANHQWLVECNDGEGAVAVRDDDSHFEGLSGLWCSFLFPLKASTRGTYPYYPQCIVRNLTAGEYHCQNQDDGTNSTQLFVSGIYKLPSSSQVFVPSLMKCCQAPIGYQIDYSRCYYKKTFDRFGEHYTGEWLVKCDTHHLVTGIGKDVNPWDNKEHFTWIQCCPFLYKQEPPATVAPPPLTIAQLLDQNPIYNNFLPSISGTGSMQLHPRQDILDEFALGRSFQRLQPSGKFFGTYAQPSQDQSVNPGFAGNSNFFVNSGYSSSPSYLTPTSNQSPFGFSNDPTQFPQFNFNQNGTNVFESFPAQNQQSLMNGPAMSAIQHAANVAAYKQFLNTFNDLLQSYSKQQTMDTFGNTHFLTSFSKPTGGKTDPMSPHSTAYFSSESATTETPIPLSLAAAQQANTGYVIPPLPSGLQNYMTITSKNPGEALSKLYTQAEQLPYNKGTYQGAEDKHLYALPSGNTPLNNFEMTDVLPVFKTSNGQNYRLMLPSHYEQLRLLPAAYRQQYLDSLAMNFPAGLEHQNSGAWSAQQQVTTATPSTSTGSTVSSTIPLNYPTPVGNTNVSSTSS